MSAVLTPGNTPRRQPDHSRIKLPNLHRRLTPALSERSDRIAAAVRRFPGGPPVRAA